MKKFFSLVATVFAIIFFTSTTFAAKVWSLPEHGLILQGQAKQDYIAQAMEKVFHPTGEEIFSVPSGWRYEKFSVGGVSVENLTNNKAKKSARVVLQLHGGGYVGALSDLYRALAVKQAVVTNAREVYMVDYRIAPENIYPAALEDAVTVYSYLAKKFGAENLILIGDSAGGNLALELCIYLKENNLSQPAVLILNSPWTTMETDLPSRSFNDKDKILGSEINPFMSGAVLNHKYSGDLNVNDYHVSPIYADLHGLPPTLVQIGGYELFRDEGIALLKKAAEDNLNITLTVYSEMSHDFAMIVPELDESIQSFIEMQNFVNLYLR